MGKEMNKEMDIDGHTIDYWFKKLKLYVILHGGLGWWQGNDKDRRVCDNLCIHGQNGEFCCLFLLPRKEKVLRASYDLERMYNINNKEGREIHPERTFCAEWIKHV